MSTENTHGLKDLFGSVPDDELQEPAAVPPAGAAVPPAVQTATPLAPAAPPGAPTLDAPAAVAPESLPARSPSPAIAPLSVVIHAANGFEAARRTVEALARQTAAQQIEVLIASPEPVEDAGSAAALRSLRAVDVPADADFAQAVAAALPLAGGDLVALLDDYAFPAGDWAEHVLRHRHEAFGALGSALANANPRSPYSWGNLLMEYGPWREGLAGGEVISLPPRNLVYRREALLGLGEDLPKLLARDGALARRLAKDGHTLKHDDQARLQVLNPSTLKGTVRARYAAGRLDGAARRGKLGLGKRLMGAFGAVFGAYPRYRQERGRLFAGDSNVSPTEHGRAVLIGMMAEGLGRAAGLMRGPGKAAQTRAALTTDRLSSLNKTDQRQFAGAKAPRGRGAARVG